jgi:hypothetical protein
MKKFFRKLFEIKSVTEEKLDEILKETGLMRDPQEDWYMAFSLFSKPPKYINIRKRIEEQGKKIDMLIKYLDIEEKKHEAKEFFAKKVAKPMKKK